MPARCLQPQQTRMRLNHVGRRRKAAAYLAPLNRNGSIATECLRVASERTTGAGRVLQGCAVGNPSNSTQANSQKLFLPTAWKSPMSPIHHCKQHTHMQQQSTNLRRVIQSTQCAWYSEYSLYEHCVPPSKRRKGHNNWAQLQPPPAPTTSACTVKKRLSWLYRLSTAPLIL